MYRSSPLRSIAIGQEKHALWEKKEEKQEIPLGGGVNDGARRQASGRNNHGALFHCSNVLISHLANSKSQIRQTIFWNSKSKTNWSLRAQSQSRTAEKKSLPGKGFSKSLRIPKTNSLAKSGRIWKTTYDAKTWKNNIQTFYLAFLEGFWSPYLFKQKINVLPYFAYVDDQQNPTQNSCGLHNSIPPKALHTSMSSSRKDHPSTRWGASHNWWFFAKTNTDQNPTMGSRLKKKGFDLKGGISSKPSDSPSNSKIWLEISENLCWVVWGEEEKPETNVHFVIK